MSSETNNKVEETEFPLVAAGEGDKDVGIDFRRKLKNEDYLTAGLGKGKEKIRVVDSFWAVWPGLGKIGWTKFQGTGDDEGKTYFKPPTKDDQEDGVVQYAQIKAVIDRLLERRNELESKVTDNYLTEIKKRLAEEARKSLAAEDVHKLPAIPAKPRPRGRPPNKPKLAKPQLDLSWKDGGKSFPKRTSQIGKRYQVQVLPAAGTYTDYPSSDEYCVVVWDPKRAKEKGILKEGQEDEDGDNSKDIISELPPNIKEDSLVRLSEVDYDIDAFQSTLSRIKPSDGSDWTQAKKDKFRDEIFRYRKDASAVAKSLKVPIKTCLTYYLGSYKSSDDYRLVKTLCVEERMIRLEASENEGTDACAICGDGGSLMICDGCEGEYHKECLKPPLRSVPEGHWECDECVDYKFLAAREYLVRNTKLFVEEGGFGGSSKQGNKKRSRDDTDAGESDTSTNTSTGPTNNAAHQKIVYRPSDEALQAIRKLAKQLSNVLSGNSGQQQQQQQNKKRKVEQEPVQPQQQSQPAAAAAAAASAATDQGTATVEASVEF